MSDIIVHILALPGIIPCQTYGSTVEWHRALANMHIAQLAFQLNDAVEDEDDARDRYTARQLFRNLATEGRLMPESEPDLLKSNGGFRLFSKDSRPANVLFDKSLQVVGVIDWEFTCAASPEFSFDPPWWLLLEEPESWTGGYSAWTEAYESRLKLFLRVLEDEEKKIGAAGLAERASRLELADCRKTERQLSQRMRKSWDKRTEMIEYAGRKSWAFDLFCWKFLDEKQRARLEYLSGPQRNVIESFVTQRVKGQPRDQEQRAWMEKDYGDRLAELLV